jgi:hypothetical protein
MRKTLMVLLLVPVCLGIWYVMAIRWAPMDTITLALPQSARNAISHALVSKAHFAAKGAPFAKRATKLSPSSEDAWTMYCATSASAGEDIDGTLHACSRATSMNSVSAYPSFHAQVIAEAYEEAHHPCDGLPLLEQTMGPEKTNNISPIFDVARLEVTCGHMDDAENHLRMVVQLWQSDMRDNNWEDRPPNNDGNPDSYEKFFRLSLSIARRNLSALLTLRHKDDEALRVCQAAIAVELKHCGCRLFPRGRVACDPPAPDYGTAI